MRMQGVKDPEAKRKAIGSGFIDVFREFAEKLKGTVGTQPRFLVQVVRSHIGSIFHAVY